MKNTLIASFVVSMALTACGGGGGGNDSPSNNNNEKLELTNEQVRSYLQSSQAGNLLPVWDTSVAATVPYAPNPTDQVNSNKTYRWSVENGDLIPIKDATNSASASTYLTQALDEIEQQLGKQIFDRTSLVNVTVANVQRGIIVRSVALSGNLDGVGNNCGHYHASDLSYHSAYVLIDTNQVMSPVVSSDWQAAMSDVGYAIRPQTYVDVNFTNPSCGPYKELIVHELGHALGLANHFDGFGHGSCGQGAAICVPAFYRVLKALYNNPANTDYTSLVIE